MIAPFSRLLAGLSFATLTCAALAQSQAPIVVHHIGPLTGVLAASNQEALDGADLYLEAFNAKGGVQGRSVKIERVDDGQDPKRTKVVFEKLVAEKKLLAVMMPRTTPSVEALIAGSAERGIPVVAPHSGASFVNDPPHREVFPMRASFRREATRAIQLQHSIGVRSFGLVLAEDAFGTDTLVGIDGTMKELKVTPVATARIDNRKPEMAAAVATMLEKRPEVVLLIVSSKAAASFVKGYRAAGGRATFISLSNTSNNDYVDALGDQVRGPIVMQVMPSPFSATTSLARDYAAAAKKRNLPLSYAGQFGYASARMLTLALAKAGRDPTPASLVQALEGLGEVDLGGYRVKYGPGDRSGSNFVESTILTHGGRMLR